MRGKSRKRSAFTLVELLIVISIIGLLVGLLLPVLASARDTAQRAACLSNMGQLETANWVYLVQNDGRMLGTSHGLSWMNSLREIDPALLMRSPVDTSPHFAGGVSINGDYRQTSYAINRYLSPDFTGGTQRIIEVDRPSATIHFGIKVFNQRSGDPGDTRPLWDHLHPDQWNPNIFNTALVNARDELQFNAHSPELSDESGRSAYGYLDGHAEIQTFEDVYVDASHNQFDPQVAR